jgi:hypothetical protein
MEPFLPIPQPVLLTALAGPHLSWFPEVGVGYYPVQAGPRAVYNEDYFARYQAQANTPIGRALMRSRVAFVERHNQGTVCDVGIGCGAFVDARRAARRTTYGYDVNPAGADWLEKRGLFVDPHVMKLPAITLWDVLEHIPDFRSLIAAVREHVFVSVPIFSGATHVLRSKHFRRDEHYWYFTNDGIVRVFDQLGFDCVETHTEETAIGREDIGSFAFQRRQS